VLLRSLLREQSEADEASKKAKATMAKAHAMEQQAHDRLAVAIKGPYWCVGVLVYWCIGVLVYWCIGVLMY